MNDTAKQLIWLAGVLILASAIIISSRRKKDLLEMRYSIDPRDRELVKQLVGKLDQLKKPEKSFQEKMKELSQEDIEIYFKTLVDSGIISPGWLAQMKANSAFQAAVDNSGTPDDIDILSGAVQDRHGVES